MKNLLIALLIIISGPLCAQTSIARIDLRIDDVPLEVIDGFHRMHLNTEVVVWRAVGDQYQAEYKEKGQVHYDLFNSSGIYIETKSPFEWEKASKQLKAGLNKTYYKYWDVLEAYRVTDETKNLYYTIHVRNKEDGTERTVYFDKEGTLGAKSKSDYTD